MDACGRSKEQRCCCCCRLVAWRTRHPVLLSLHLLLQLHWFWKRFDPAPERHLSVVLEQGESKGTLEEASKAAAGTGSSDSDSM